MKNASTTSASAASAATIREYLRMNTTDEYLVQYYRRLLNLKSVLQYSREEMWRGSMRRSEDSHDGGRLLANFNRISMSIRTLRRSRPIPFDEPGQAVFQVC